MPMETSQASRCPRRSAERQDQQGDAGQGDERAGRLAAAERDVAEIGVQVAPDVHRCQRRHEVEHPARAARRWLRSDG